MLKKLAKYTPYLVTLLVIIIVFLISHQRLFENYELATLDVRYNFRPKQPMHPDIVIIEIGDDSVEKIGRWPFDREWHSSLLNILSHYKARAVFFDVIFSESSSGDAGLIEASRGIDVYYPTVLELACAKDNVMTSSRCIAPLLQDFKKVSKGVGYINTPTDIDGKMRRVPLKIDCGKSMRYAVSYLMACDYLGLEKESLSVPVDDTSSMLVNYPGKWVDSFKHLSYIDIIMSQHMESKGESGIVDLKGLKDKICFVGLTATGTHDMKAMPLETVYAGMGVQASAFNTLVTGKFITRAHRLVNVAILLILASFIIITCYRYRPLISLFISLGVTFLFILLAFLLFAFLRIWIDLFFPVIIMVTAYLYATFQRYTSERRKRMLIEKELTIAQSIQKSFLPEAVPQVEGLEIVANMLTAHHVGGDLYDFVDYKDGTLGIMIGDVSGKGVPAALFMAKAVSEFRIFSKDEKQPSKILKNLNDQVMATSTSNLFVTISHLYIDIKNKALTLAAGGHPPLIIARKGEIKTLDAKEGLAIGMFESDFSDEKFTLESGDLLVMYTDGVTEAVNSKKEEYEMERLTEFVKRHKDLSCKEFIDAIYKEMKNFEGKGPQHDDITVIAIRVL